MNKFELNEFLNQFVEIIEEGGSKLKAEAENYTQNFKSRREISKLESQIRDDYVNIGLLVYELHKMGKTFDYSDFEEKFNSIDLKKEMLLNLEKDTKEDFEDVFKSESEDSSTEEEPVNCPNCGTENTKFVAYCKNCGEEL